MTDTTIFDYYYGDESEQFSFYRIPRQLVTGEAFRRLSTDAKLLYGLLLDRMGLSAKNGWYDEQGRVFIYYTLEEIQSDLCCGHEKAVKGQAHSHLCQTVYHTDSTAPTPCAAAGSQTSENRTLVILNQIKLILVS